MSVKVILVTSISSNVALPENDRLAIAKLSFDML
jgi:hypothetical protein